MLREIALHHFLFALWLNQLLIESSSAIENYVDSTTLVVGSRFSGVFQDRGIHKGFMAYWHFAHDIDLFAVTRVYKYVNARSLQI